MDRICCIIPLFNAGRYISRTLDSVFAQTRIPDEIVVINDGSTDHSLEVLQNFSKRITVISTAHRGVSAALNTGIKNTAANLITFIDSDDLWVPDKIEKQLAYLGANPQKSAVFGLVEQFTSEDLADKKIQFPQNGQVVPGFSKLTLMITRAALLQAGYFNEDLERGDFIEWFSRFKQTGLQYEMLPERFALRRLRNDSLSSDQDAAKDLAKAMKMHLDRQRSK